MAAADRVMAGVLSRKEAAAFAAGVREQGGTLVFTNGVFDLLHPGHIRYLQEARALGDALLVGLNSDRSVQQVKGPSRPITPEQERGELLLALSSVDGVTLFDEQTPYELIAAVRPTVLVKGADWAAEDIVGRDLVEAGGGRVVRINLAAGHSTTELIRRIRALT